MKRDYLAWLLIGILVFGLSAAWADTTWVAAGTVQGQWDAAHSPYIVQGDIHVPPNAELVIQPGVEIYFDGPYNLAVDSTALIMAVGTVADSIRFHTDTLANPARWRGLSVRDAADTCRFAYCVFEYAERPDGDDDDGGALYATDTHLRLTHSRFSFNRVDSANWGGYGGSLVVSRGSVRIEDCVFEESSAHSGGALFFIGTHGDVLRTTIRHCAAQRGGGLLTVNQYGLTLRDCLIEGNQATWYGGGLWEDFGNTRFENCTFRTNVCLLLGGAAAVRTAGSFFDCRFEDNHTDSLGGGVFVFYHSADYPLPAYDRCVFRGNTALRGGGICVGPFQTTNQLRIHRSVFAANFAETGGALYCLPGTTSEVELWSTAFVYTEGGAAIANPPRTASSFHHCALFENTGGDFTGTTDPTLGVINSTNRNGDPCDSRQNLYLPPLFVDADAGDFHLTAESPYIDAGFDYGEERFDDDGTWLEIGAYYFDQASAAEPRPAPVAEFRLEPAYPNPFNASARLSFSLPATGHARLAIYDVLGREVAVLADELLPAGSHTRTFDGAGLSSGLYFARLEVTGHSAVQKMVLMK